MAKKRAKRSARSVIAEAFSSRLRYWIERGLRGVRLETIQVGGARCTTEAALRRFFTALSDNATQIPNDDVTRLHTVERQLDRIGIR